MASKKARPKPEAPKPAFVETEAEASLRHIAEAARDRRAKEEAAIQAKAMYQVAKEDLKAAKEAERKTIDDETTELPLFPRPRPAEPKPQGEAFPPADEIESAVESDPIRAAFLANLPIDHADLVKLGNEDIQTVGELEDALANGAGNRIVGLIGQPGLSAILDAITQYRGQAEGESGAA